MWVPKLLPTPVKIRIFGPKTAIYAPKYAGSFGALLVSWLVVVTRGLYLARHLFTFFSTEQSAEKQRLIKIR